MGIIWLSPAGASSISAPDRLKDSQTGLPVAVGLPVRAKVVTSATSWSCSACWFASSAGVTGLRYQAPTCDAPAGEDTDPVAAYGGMSLSVIRYPYTGIQRARSWSVMIDWQTVPESAATVRQAVYGESNRDSGYRAITCGANFPNSWLTTCAYSAGVVGSPIRFSSRSVPAMTRTRFT